MRRYPRQNHRVLQVVARLLVPFMILFGLYVQFHGDYGPGCPPSWARVMMSLGVLIYAGTGVVTMLLGANLLDYDVLAHDPLHGQHWGIFAVELGVGVTVTGVMISLFYGFSSARDAIDRQNSGLPSGVEASSNVEQSQ